MAHFQAEDQTGELGWGDGKNGNPLPDSLAIVPEVFQGAAALVLARETKEWDREGKL